MVQPVNLVDFLASRHSKRKVRPQGVTPNYTTKQQRGRTKSTGKVGPNLSRAHANESAVAAQLEKMSMSLAHAV